jgi:hypothetical protein
MNWFERQAVRVAVGRLGLQEVTVSKWILAGVAALAALFAGGLATGLDSGQLTVGVISASAAAAILAGVGKLYDPGHTLAVPRVAKALGLGIAAAVAVLGPAAADGVVSGTEWGGILSALIITAWSKWTTPDKILS